MAVSIPLRSDLPHYASDVELDAVTYRLVFDWNSRTSLWTLRIEAADETTLASGIGLRLGALLLKGIGRAEGLPPGDLTLIDETGTHTEPGLNSLGVTHTLLYHTRAELTAAGL